MPSYLHTFPAPFIFFYEVPNHEEIKARILEKIQDGESLKRSSNLESNSNVNTSYWDEDLTRWLGSSDFLKDIVWEPLDALLETEAVPKTPKVSTLRDIWVNQFEAGSWHGTHIHSTSDFSGIYVVSLEGENPTSFISPGDGSSLFFSVKETKEVKEGTVMLFPSRLLHQVNPAQGPRISIAYNVVSTF
jgi:hypothetical protein